MYVNQFDNQLKSAKTYNSYLFYGSSDYLIDLYINRTILSNNIEKKDTTTIYFDQYNFKDISTNLKQNSLFLDKNFYIIKISKKIDSKEVKELVQICQTNKNSTMILAVYTKEKLQTYERYFTTKVDGVFVRFFQPDFNQAIRLLKTQADNLKLDYHDDAIVQLHKLHDENISLSANDLTKLQLCQTTITTDIVYKTCFGLGHIDLQDFLFDMFEKKLKNHEIDKIVEDLDAIFLLSSISRFVHELFMINSYTRAYGEPDPKVIFGFIPPPKIWNKKVIISTKISIKKFYELMNYLSKIELRLKRDRFMDKSGFLKSKLMTIPL